MHKLLPLYSLIFLFVYGSNNAMAARLSDVGGTKHNFSSALEFSAPLPTGETRVVKAVNETEICIFCHTPHAASKDVPPIWNRELSVATYNNYDSSSMEAVDISNTIQATNVSKLCLSCHDGTIAVGSVNVNNSRFTDQKRTTEDIALIGTAGGFIPDGEGKNTGFTRNLGSDLRNDHPISIRFDAQLADIDGELRLPLVEKHIVINVPGAVTAKDALPLEVDLGTITGGSVECNSCHDPHIRDSNNENIKFLRLNRLQKAEPVSAAFSANNDIICLACHDKAGWIGSAHANPNVADEVYSAKAAALREFPIGTKVWQAACVSCHDAHTVAGSRRLLREGVDGKTVMSSAGLSIKIGDGLPSIEETCYLCHSHDVETLDGQLRGPGDTLFEVPNIKYDYTALLRHEPITNDDQLHVTEVHDIGTTEAIDPLLVTGYGNEGRKGIGKDFIESATVLGRNMSPGNRHAECTDCHNPHRATKNRLISDDPAVPDIAGTHSHTAAHSNIASGVLRGTWGLEPEYGFGTEFGTNPNSFRIKRGNADNIVVDRNTDPNNYSYVTREYQICMKCHSNYAYGDIPPDLGYYPGGTPNGTNGLSRYTNQAMEFQSPLDHMGEGLTVTPSGAAPQFQPNNHRSWHPVMRPTGRTVAIRNANTGIMLPPFDADTDIGIQTMYCSDCHGSSTAPGTVVPNGGENGAPWGPHGSNEDFILKGPSSGDSITGTGAGRPGDLCFKCHSYDQYANPSTQVSGNIQGSGFSNMNSCPPGETCSSNLHVYHASVVNNLRCNLCHIAIPHGWKNKAFLVNLNDVGTEAGLALSTQVRNGTVAPYFQEPYYYRAALKVKNFATSGNWIADNCGSAGAPGNNQVGLSWMRDSSEACVNLP
ncbi:MAG: hypothetical protein ACC707_11515 [Thiohalomonadales bacterium]